MERPLDYLIKYNQKHNWLIGDHSQQVQQIASELYLELSKNTTPLKIILAEREPVKFLAKFLAASTANCAIFLCNPDWGSEEFQQVFDLVEPDIVWGIENWSAKEKTSKNTLSTAIPQTIMIPTGGSSGKIKFAIHTWSTLMASVRGFSEYFQIESVNSCCVLPLYHVSGLMQFIRSLTTGGKLLILPFPEIVSGQIPAIDPSEYFISLVPTQLQRLLENPELTQWLTQFFIVLLGGAPAWEELLEKARFHQIRLAPTYGMTETAAQIATLKPDDFLQGKLGCGQILPHVKIDIRDETGKILNFNQLGNITIQAESLALGYYPHLWSNQGYFLVDDIGLLDEKNYLYIVGRSSEKIITGGENVYPLEVESAIKKNNLVMDICIIGVPDKQWGQAITAIYVPKIPHISLLEIETYLKSKLSKFKIPKYWIPVANIPRNSQGKINQLRLKEIAQEYLSNHTLN
jgi:O-succinylbenzoic acid--CoA ligase